MSGYEDPIAYARRLREEFDRGFACPHASLGEETERLCTLRIQGDRFAIMLRELSGLQARRKVLFLPGTAGTVGVCGVRGKLVAVYSLARLLGYDVPDEPRWLALRGTGDPIAFAFGHLEGCEDVEATRIHASTQAPYQIGLVAFDSGPCTVVDVGALERDIRARRVPAEQIT